MGKRISQHEQIVHRLDYLERRAALVPELVAALEKYGQHLFSPDGGWCRSTFKKRWPCDCGLADKIAKAKAVMG